MSSMRASSPATAMRLAVSASGPSVQPRGGGIGLQWAMLTLLACAAGTVKVADDSAVPPPEPTLAVTGPAALAPLYAVPGEWTFTAVGGEALTVSVLDTKGVAVRTLLDSGSVAPVTWDGRDDAGAVLPTGTYTLAASLGDGEAEVATTSAPVELVRVGAAEGTFGGERLPLMWHRAAGPGGYASDGGDAVTFALESIDDGTTPTPLPTLWDDLDEPPESEVGANLPAAYAWDARPVLYVTVGGEVGTAELGLRVAGWTVTGEVVPGRTLAVTKDEALATGPSVIEESLTLEWTSGETVIGTQELPIRLYALLGPVTFEESGVPYEPWLAVIDPALRAMGPTEPTDTAVISGLVAYIHDDLGLSYDTRWGASAYTEYDWNTYDDAHFDLTAFLARSRGSVVNCTDCASILEAHANMLGAVLSYTIITPSFDLNYILAIGGDEYTHCPFGGSSCGFSYHAVTTPDDGNTIYDATLALDGDSDPGSSPSEILMVQAIDGAEYLDRLVMRGRPDYVYTQKETLQ